MYAGCVCKLCVCLTSKAKKKWESSQEKTHPHTWRLERVFVSGGTDNVEWNTSGRMTAYEIRVTNPHCAPPCPANRPEDNQSPPTDTERVEPSEDGSTMRTNAFRPEREERKIKIKTHLISYVTECAQP